MEPFLLNVLNISSENLHQLVGASVSCAIHYLTKRSCFRDSRLFIPCLKMLSSYMRRISIQKPFNLVLNCNSAGDFVYRPTEFTMSCNRKMSPTMFQGISKNNVAVFETLVKSTLEVLLALKCKFQTNIIYVMEFRCRCLT